LVSILEAFINSSFNPRIFIDETKFMANADGKEKVSPYLTRKVSPLFNESTPQRDQQNKDWTRPFEKREKTQEFNLLIQFY
jgi:hypothetical protein